MYMYMYMYMYIVHMHVHIWCVYIYTHIYIYICNHICTYVLIFLQGLEASDCRSTGFCGLHRFCAVGKPGDSDEAVKENSIPQCVHLIFS